MNKRIYAVVDLDDDELYFGIETFLPIEKVIAIINHTKQNLAGEWSTEDIMMALPRECEIIDIERIYI